MLQAWFMRRISCGPPLRGVAGEVGDESDGTPSSFPGVACLCANPEMKEYAVKTSTPPAPARPRRACARVAWAALVLLSPPALAVPFATSPVLLSPNGASNAPVDLGTRPAVNGYSLSSQYYDPAIDDNRVSNSGAVSTRRSAGGSSRSTRARCARSRSVSSPSSRTASCAGWRRTFTAAIGGR